MGLKEVKVRLPEDIVEALGDNKAAALREIVEFWVKNQKYLKELTGIDSKKLVKEFIKLKKLEEIIKELRKEVNELYEEYNELVRDIEAVKLLREAENAAKATITALTITKIEDFDNLEDKVDELRVVLEDLRKKASAIITLLRTREEKRRRKRLEREARKQEVYGWRK